MAAKYFAMPIGILVRVVAYGRWPLIGSFDGGTNRDFGYGWSLREVPVHLLVFSNLLRLFCFYCIFSVCLFVCLCDSLC